MKIKQHSGHAEPNQPKGRRIRCRVLEVSVDSFMARAVWLKKERQCKKEWLRPFDQSPVVALSGLLAIGRLDR
jgi:hypothetical protein